MQCILLKLCIERYNRFSGSDSTGHYFMPVFLTCQKFSMLITASSLSSFIEVRIVPFDQFL